MIRRTLFIILKLNCIIIYYILIKNVGSNLRSTFFVTCDYRVEFTLKKYYCGPSLNIICPKNRIEERKTQIISWWERVRGVCFTTHCNINIISNLQSLVDRFKRSAWPCPPKRRIRPQVRLSAAIVTRHSRAGQKRMLWVAKLRYYILTLLR